jgi:hypothetical protein
MGLILIKLSMVDQAGLSLSIVTRSQAAYLRNWFPAGTVIYFLLGV